MASETALVVNRCNSASESNVLDLSNCRLNNLPMAVYMLTSSFNTTITSVDLSNNNLTTIPAKVLTNFPNIASLDISENKIPEEKQDELKLIYAKTYPKCQINF